MALQQEEQEGFYEPFDNHARNSNSAVDRQPIELGDLVSSLPPLDFGSSANRGLKKQELEQLPSFIYKSTTSNASESNECSVCFDSFRSGEQVMALICSHKFHGKCIVPWLKVSSNEPKILN